MADRIPSLNLLRTFEAAARHKSFKLAANELCVSPPAVSYQVKSLEEQLGFDLFVRKNKNLELTNAGVEYFSKISAPIHTILDATKQLSAPKDKPTLTISAVPVVAQFHITPYIHEFQEQYPELNIEVIADAARASFADGKLDIALRHRIEDDPDLVFVPIFDVSLCPICSPDFLQKHADADLQNFSNVRLIKQNIDTNAWPTWLKQWNYPLTGHNEMILSTFQAVLDATRNGLGIGLAYGTTIYPAIQRKEFDFVFADKVTPYGTLYMAYSAKHLGNPIFDAFEKWFKKSNELRFSYPKRLSGSP